LPSVPLLCVFPKPSERELPAPVLAELGRSLCPYRGEVSCTRLGHALIYASELTEFSAGSHGQTCSVPRADVQTAHSAWLQVRMDAQGHVCFETDPLGTFPLWLVETSAFIAVSAEVKALRALASFRVVLKPELERLPARRSPDFTPYENVRRVWPGATLSVASDGSWREQRRTPLMYQPPERFAQFDESRDALEHALRVSAAEIPRAAHRFGSFLSGGIDSSLATSLSQQQGPLCTFTLGSEFGDEYADAAALASHLNLPHERVFAAADEAKRHFERAVFCNETVDGLTAETLAQLSMLSEAARAAGVFSVVTGYGADLLFGSMLRHRLYMQVTGVDDLQSLVERTTWTGEFCPFFAWSLDVRLYPLFWQPALMNVAFRVPDEHNFAGDQEKCALRAAAVQGGLLTREHAYRRKQALTDGTRFNQLLSRALGLSSAHAYDQKNAACSAQLRRMFQT
jgi:asparagine synthetase B (glutamine-hydrolysing)